MHSSHMPESRRLKSTNLATNRHNRHHHGKQETPHPQLRMLPNALTLPGSSGRDGIQAPSRPRAYLSKHTVLLLPLHEGPNHPSFSSSLLASPL